MSRRILRLGNYTIQQTSAYDNTDPAGTPSSWGTTAEVAAMDQSLLSTAGELTREGVLVTFTNTADFLAGAVVKVRPSYSGLELPFIELWTHDSDTSAWTLRRRLSITNLLVGVRSGEFKIFDLRLFDDLDGTTIDQMWITMDPGAAGAPVMRFLAIHLFGDCNPVIVTPNPPGVLEPGDECVIDPEQCLDDPIDPNPDDVPPDEPPTFPTVDLCDPEALEAFKAQLTPEQLAYFEELIEAAELPCPEDPTNNDPTDDPYVDPVTGDPGTGPEPPAPTCPDFILAASRSSIFTKRIPAVGGIPSNVSTQLTIGGIPLDSENIIELVREFPPTGVGVTRFIWQMQGVDIIDYTPTDIGCVVAIRMIAVPAGGLFNQSGWVVIPQCTPAADVPQVLINTVDSASGLTAYAGTPILEGYFHLQRTLPRDPAIGDIFEIFPTQIATNPITIASGLNRAFSLAWNYFVDVRIFFPTNGCTMLRSHSAAIRQAQVGGGNPDPDPLVIVDPC